MTATCGRCSGPRCIYHRDPFPGSIVALPRREDLTRLTPVLGYWDGDPDEHEWPAMIWIMAGHNWISLPAGMLERVAIRAAMVNASPSGTAAIIGHRDEDDDATGETPDDMRVWASKNGDDVRLAQGGDHVWLREDEVDPLFRALYWIGVAQMLAAHDRRDQLAFEQGALGLERSPW